MAEPVKPEEVTPLASEPTPGVHEALTLALRTANDVDQLKAAVDQISQAKKDGTITADEYRDLANLWKERNSAISVSV